MMMRMKHAHEKFCSATSVCSWPFASYWQHLCGMVVHGSRLSRPRAISATQLAWCEELITTRLLVRHVECRKGKHSSRDVTSVTLNSEQWFSCLRSQRLPNSVDGWPSLGMQRAAHLRRTYRGQEESCQEGCQESCPKEEGREEGC